MTREEKMMNAAEAYAAGLYADEPVSFSTEEDRCVTMNDFCAGWYAADRCSRWIPVEEELPKRLLSVEPIIDVIMANGICVGQGTYNDITGQWHWYATGAIANDITHWMPMPIPPQPNKKDEKGWIPAPSGNPA